MTKPTYEELEAEVASLKNELMEAKNILDELQKGALDIIKTLSGGAR